MKTVNHTCPDCVPEYCEGTKYTDQCKSCKGTHHSMPCPRCAESKYWLAGWNCPACNEANRVPTSEYEKLKKQWPRPVTKEDSENDWDYYYSGVKK